MMKPDWEDIETAYWAESLTIRVIADIEVLQRDVAEQYQLLNPGQG